MDTISPRRKQSNNYENQPQPDYNGQEQAQWDQYQHQGNQPDMQGMQQPYPYDYNQRGQYPANNDGADMYQPYPYQQNDPQGGYYDQGYDQQQQQYPYDQQQYDYNQQQQYEQYPNQGMPNGYHPNYQLPNQTNY